jgi:uncharacterized protein (UPF0216 family)
MRGRKRTLTDSEIKRNRSEVSYAAGRQYPFKKENLSTIQDSLGSDEKTEMLLSPSCKHIFVPKKDTFTFFEHLDTASIKLLHKEKIFNITDILLCILGASKVCSKNVMSEKE